MIPVGDVKEWLRRADPDISGDYLAVDEGGLTLRLLDEEGYIKDTLEIGGDPAEDPFDDQ